MREQDNLAARLCRAVALWVAQYLRPAVDGNVSHWDTGRARIREKVTFDLRKKRDASDFVYL